MGSAARAADPGTAGDFDEALAGALAERGPSVVEVDMTAIGPMPRPFVPPLPVP